MQTAPPSNTEPAAECATKRATLVVFTLGASWETRRRRLLPPAGGSTEEELHQACLDAALAAGRKADCRLEVCSPHELDLPADVAQRRQSGRGFADRLRHATMPIQAAGGPMIVVAGDVPELEAGHLHRTLELLDEDPQRVVLGPSPDGGFYLLATVEPVDEALDVVRWCCRDTLHSLCRALAREGREVVLLEPLTDLDRRSDLERWLARHRASGHHLQALIAALQRILSALSRPAGGLEAAARARRALVGPPLRAPPIPA